MTFTLFSPLCIVNHGHTIILVLHFEMRRYSTCVEFVHTDFFGNYLFSLISHLCIGIVSFIFYYTASPYYAFAGEAKLLITYCS